jgi:fumarate reductase subunit C
LKAIYHIEESFIEQIQKTFLIGISSKQIANQFCRQRRQIMEYKKFLEKNFSLIPPLWFLFEFLYIAGTMIFLTNPEARNATLITFFMNYLPVLFSIVILAYVSFVAGSSISYVQDKLDVMVTIIIEKKQSDVWREFLTQIDREKSFWYSAWNLFPINQSLILTFTSALISFSVLLIQLSSNLNSTH